jgi:hypothetical protein
VKGGNRSPAARVWLTESMAMAVLRAGCRWRWRRRGPRGIQSGQRDAGRRRELAGVVDMLFRVLERRGVAAGAVWPRCSSGELAWLLRCSCRLGRRSGDASRQDEMDGWG